MRAHSMVTCSHYLFRADGRFVESGAQVQQFDKLCEVQSDKATVEITSRYDGRVVKLHYKPGDVAKVGAPLVDIDTGDDGAEATPVESKAEVKKTEVQTAAVEQPQTASESNNTAGDDVKTFATPAVRRIAKEHKVNLASVKGTGKGGRVTKEDILAFVESGGKSAPAPASSVKQQQQPSTSSAKGTIHKE